jgi:hypothetical protein
MLFLAVRRFAGEDTASRNWMALLAIVLAAVALALLARLRPRAWTIGVAFAAPAVIAMPLGWTETIERYQETKIEALKNHRPEAVVAAQVDRITRERGTNVAYAGMNRPYVFEGAELQNVVNMVPTRGDALSRFFDWTFNVEIPYGNGHYGVWLQNLRALEIRYLVLVRSEGDEPERTWARGHPEFFRPLIESPQAEVYEVADVHGD